MDDLRKLYRVAAIIGLVMILSVLGYTVVVEVLRNKSTPVLDPETNSHSLDRVKYFLVGISVVLFFVIRIVKQAILGAGMPQSVSGRAASNPDGDAPPIQRLLVSSVVGYALSEVPAIFGLVLFLLGGDASDFYLFLLISLFFFSNHFPRFSQWEEWVKTR